MLLKLQNVLTVLVNQHPYRRSTHVEPVKEVLYRVLDARIHVMAFFKLQNTLSHSLYHIAVTVANVNEAGAKPERIRK